MFEMASFKRILTSLFLVISYYNWLPYIWYKTSLKCIFDEIDDTYRTVTGKSLIIINTTLFSEPNIFPTSN